MMAAALQAGRPADSIMPLMRPKPVAGARKVSAIRPVPAVAAKSISNVV